MQLVDRQCESNVWFTKAVAAVITQSEAATARECLIVF